MTADNIALVANKYLDGVLQLSVPLPAPYALPAAGSSLRVGYNGGVTSLYYTSVGSTTWTVPAGVTSVSVLVVAGGGGGGGTNDRSAGGGGAGGFICQTSFAVTPGAVIPITVGAGGTGGVINSGNNGLNGANSVFGTLNAVGGGGGGANGKAGSNGGSGGGLWHGAGTTYLAGTGTAGQGFGGGSGVYNSGSATGTFAGSGGGGAGGVGGNGVVQTSYGGGYGGPGAQCAPFGSVYFAGGGGGAAQSMSTSPAPFGWAGGLGGVGGGGNGCTSLVNPIVCVGVSGQPNSGGGGGGGGTGGNGGSGVVIVSFAAPGAIYTGVLADLRLYNRVLLPAELLTLAAPQLPFYSGLVNPQPTVGVVSYAWPSCAAGFYGTSSLLYTKNTLTNTWVPSGTYNCQGCPANTYSYAGATSGCASCPAGTSLVSPALGCLPSALTGPTNALGFYFSGAQAEGTAAFQSVANPGGVSYVTDRLGNANGAITLASGTYISSSSYAVAPANLPTGNNVGSGMSISAWVNCPAAFASGQVMSVVEWGAAGLSTSLLKLGLSVGAASCSGGASAALPGPFQGVCDGTWHHIAITEGDGAPNAIKQYVDGALLATTPATFSYSLPAAGDQLRIGWNGAPVMTQFTTVGSTSFTVPAGVTTVNVMVVAGGGGGGGSTDRTAGGGGGGGLICTTLAVTPGQVIPISVGAGGAAGPKTAGASAGSLGGNSTFGALTALGGGGGGGWQTSASPATSGGSGGGAGYTTVTGTLGAAAALIVPAQGFAGGANWVSTTTSYGSGGGGGAGGPGLPGLSTSAGGAGGPGAQCLLIAGNTNCKSLAGAAIPLPGASPLTLHPTRS